MKNVEKEGTPLLYIERSRLFLLIAILITSSIVFYGYLLLKDVNPMGFLVMIPGSVFSFQCLWWLLNPFALVFENKLEIKQSLFHHKLRYFVDVKRISESKKGKLYITYNDDEMESLGLFGINPKQVTLLRDELKKHVSESLKTRP